MNNKQLAAISIVIALFAVSAGFSLCQAQGTSVQIVPSQVSVQETQTFTVDVSVGNVQNLYGLDVTVTWDETILQIQGISTHLGVESNTGGVLHTAQGADIIVAVNETSPLEGKWQIAATSAYPASSFNGTGTLATLTFNVTRPGQTTLNLVSILTDRPLPEEVSEPIPHEDYPATVNASVIPEIPQTAFLVILAVSATAVIVYARKKTAKN